MMNCPICDNSLQKVASTDQGWCEPCDYIATGSLLKESFDYTPGAIVDCRGPNGEPGYKASYENVKCYLYRPGDDGAEKEAKRKAFMQDYHKQRSKRVQGSIRKAEGDVKFNNSTTPDVVSGASSPDVAALPSTIKTDGVAIDGVSQGDSFGKNSILGPMDGDPAGDRMNNPNFASKKNSYKEQNMSTDIENLANRVIKQAGWFDGSSASIYTRLEQIQDIIDDLRTASSSPHLDNISLSKFADIMVKLETERDQLQRTASVYVDFDTEEYLQSLPGGTVASVYRTTDFGTADLGEDDGSISYKAAKAVEAEFNGADWVSFVTAGAETWVMDQTKPMLRDELATREAAVYYVERKTLPILDIEKRAAIIDNFVTNVEIVRREVKSDDATREFKTAKLKSSPTLSDDILGTTANWF